MNLVELFKFIDKTGLLEIKTSDGEIIFQHNNINLSNDKKNLVHNQPVIRQTYIREVDIK